MLNQVVLVGRLTENPVVEETSNGKKYTAIIKKHSAYYIYARD